MSKRIQNRVAENLNPRDELLTKYKVDLPIEGGWGYQIEDAVVINRHHSSVDQELPFNGVAVERTFIQQRLYIELIQMESRKDELSGIKWTIKSQRLIHKEGKSFDYIECQATALKTEDWYLLKEIWEGPNGFQSPDFDKENHLRLQKSKLLYFDCEYWFDITSFNHNF